jgi:hypothetical protein
MTQLQRRDWQDSFSITHHSWQIAPVPAHRTPFPPEPILSITFWYLAVIYERQKAIT